MYLLFDTETTGKPKNYNGSYKDLDNWPRITQIAWQLFDKDYNLINKFESLIKPNGWEVPKEQFFIDNNMSTERCETEGVDILEVLEKFIIDLEKCEFVLAHNLNFDLAVVSSEMYRLGLSSKNKPTKICTMQTTTDYLQLAGPYGFKWPSLKELHNHLFNCDFEGAHDASDDVTATAKCFFKLKQTTNLYGKNI